MLLLLLLLLLSARVPVTAWQRCAFVCHVLVALEQLSNRAPVSFFFAVQQAMLGNLLMLVRWSAARAVRSCTRTATRVVRVLLESSVVARVLLSVAPAAAAAECS